LTDSQAHMDWDEAVGLFPIEQINIKFPNGKYSAWGLVEHMRRTQADILEFITAKKYKDKKWPQDFWPDSSKKATADEWNITINGFAADLKKLVKLISNSQLDLSAKVPGGNGQTYLREFLLVADHNAYHTGELAIMRQVMNNWGPRDE